MKSLKLIVRLSLFVLALSAVAASTHAQQCPGYNPTMTQGDPSSASGIIPSNPCSGKPLYSTASFYETNSITDYCGYLSTGQLSHTAPVTGNGVASCTPVRVYCEPFFDAYLTVAQNPQDYNRFYYQAYDQNYTSNCVRATTYSRQDFWQCGWYVCPPPPSGSGSCPNPHCSPDNGYPVDYCAYPNTGCQPGDTANGWCCQAATGSPVIIDINGTGFNLTSAAGGVLFDISGTGHPIQMGWTASGAANAFLALPGPDGVVHNGKQLFGNFTPQPPSSTPNGFAALAVYDLPANGGNGDGIIDARDAVFSSLRLWVDANHDGISQVEELHTLPSLGVNSISLNYKLDRRTDQYGNVFRYRAQINPGDPTSTGRMAYDVFFVASQPVSKNIPRSLIPRTLIPADAHKCAVPGKEGMLSGIGKL